MKKYSMAAAAKNLSQLIREACKGEDVYVTQAGKPVVKVVPLEQQKERVPGGFEGQLSWTPDAFDPLTEEELKELRFEWDH
jgi:prevent-host-death family protein